MKALLLTLSLLVIATSAVDILIFNSCGCDGDLAQTSEGEDAVCDDIDINTCCGELDLDGCGVAGRWGDTIPIDNYVLQSYSQQNGQICAVNLVRTDMPSDAETFVCADGPLEGTAQGGEVEPSGASKRRRADTSKCVAPNASAFIVNGTVYTIRKDSELAPILADLDTPEAKRDFAVAYGKKAGHFGKSGME